LCFTQSASTKRVLQALIRYLSRRFLNDLDLEIPASTETISAVAGIIASVTSQDEASNSHLIDWCATSSGAGLGDSVAIRRAVVAVLAKDRNAITTVVERASGQFGDELYIKHAAIIQQQGTLHTDPLMRCQYEIILISRKSMPRSFY
jgi:telomere length regulation protein